MTQHRAPGHRSHSADEALARIDRGVAQAESRASRAREFADGYAALEGTGASDGGDVKVTVGAEGLLSRLTITDAAASSSGASVRAAILEANAAAVADLRQRPGVYEAKFDKRRAEVQVVASPEFDVYSTVKQLAASEGFSAVLGEGNAITVTASGVQDSRTPNLDVIVLGGCPIREPVAWMGPFVMNTREEIMQAVADYQAGRLGTIPAVHNAPSTLIESRQAPDPS